MKILFFIHFPIPFPGAAWTRIGFFAEYFKDRGNEVAVAGAFSLMSLGKAGTKQWKGLKIFNLTPIIMTANVLSLAFNIVSSIFASALLIILLRPRVVVISVPRGDTALGCFLVAKAFRRTIIFDYRDEWEDHIINNTKSKIYKRSYKFLKTIMTKCYQKSTLVIAVTEAFVSNLFARGVVNVKLLMNGADTNVFRPYDKIVTRDKIGYHNDDFIFVYSGKIGEYYRVDVVVKALSKLISKSQNVKLLLVGRDPEIEEVMSLSKDLRIQNNVFYLGAKSEKIELAEILSASDVGIVPYDANPLWKNSLPAKVFEYFACGLPVVATAYKDSELGKLISEHNLGIVSEPNDVNALANSLEKIYNDKIFRENAGRRAILLAIGRYDRNKIAEEFLNILKG